MIISCDVCIMVCQQDPFQILAWARQNVAYSSQNPASRFAKKMNVSKFKHGGDKMLYIADKTQHVCVCVCLCETIQMGIHVIIPCDVCIMVCQKNECL